MFFACFRKKSEELMLVLLFSVELTWAPRPGVSKRLVLLYS